MSAVAGFPAKGESAMSKSPWRNHIHCEEPLPRQPMRMVLDTRKRGNPSPPLWALAFFSVATALDDAKPLPPGANGDLAVAPA